MFRNSDRFSSSPKKVQTINRGTCPSEENVERVEIYRSVIFVLQNHLDKKKRSDDRIAYFKIKIMSLFEKNDTRNNVP